MAGDGINISNFSQRIQDFIKEQKIDADNTGTINKAELAQLLSAAKAEGIDAADIVDFSNMKEVMPYKPPIKGVIELVQTITELEEAKEQDKVEFDTQLTILHKALQKFQEARESDQVHADEFVEIMHELGKKDEVKYQERFNKLLDLVPDDAAFVNNKFSIGGDENQPNDGTDESAPNLDGRLGVAKKQPETIKDFIKILADDTLNKVKKHGSVRQELAQVLDHAVHEGNVEQVKQVLTQLIEETHVYAKEAETAMNALVNIGMEALKSVVSSASSNDLDDISKLTDTIKGIKDEAINDQKEFEKFIAFTQDKLAKLDGVQDRAVDELKKQLYIMHDTLTQKAEDIEKRFDNVLNSFEKCVDGDIHDNQKLGAHYDEVEKNKGESVERFKANSDSLQMTVAKLLSEVAEGELNNIPDLSKMLIAQLTDTSITHMESMVQLESKALEFLKDMIPDHMTSGINSAPASEQLASNYYDVNGHIVQNPVEGRMYLHNGKKVVYHRQ